jgi:RNA polymerase sigma-70 factor (ECF subfamily)
VEGAWSLADGAKVPARPFEADATLEERLAAELPALRAFAQALVGRSGSAADADDLAQEALARAWRSRARFDAARALQPWLRATAVRAWIDLRRRSARRAEVEASRGLETAAHAEPARPFEEDESLARLLADLAPLEREVLLRFHRQGEPVSAIAAALGLPVGTVKSHLHRARRKLAERGGPGR